MWETILWIAAVVIGIFGVIRLLQRDIVMGVVLIVVALLIGPEGAALRVDQLRRLTPPGPIRSATTISTTPMTMSR